jgi:RHS repeat-associated protein
MSGKPAARLLDATLKGGPIIKGSLTVLIGSQGGVACSECPGGTAVGSPVNPSLGAKFLDGAGELDVALPGPLSLAWQRQYSSYVNLKEGARCGLHGYGWSSTFDLELTHGAGELKLHDTRGRTITFDEALSPGSMLYSASEDIWIVRGGFSSTLQYHSTTQAQGEEPVVHHDAQHWSTTARFAHIAKKNPHWIANPNLIFAASGGADSAVWCFAPASLATVEVNGHNAAPLDSDYPDLRSLTDPLGRCWLYRIVDRFGREQLLQRDTHTGLLTGFIDPLGRHIEFVYTQLYDAQPASGHWQADSGLRLAQIVLRAQTHNQLAPIEPSELGRDEEGRIILARYHYGDQGDLIQVDRREGIAARRFVYANHMMIGHAYFGDEVKSNLNHRADSTEKIDPQSLAANYPHHYRYDHYEPGARVLEQFNRDGLAYRFAYLHTSRDGQSVHTQTVVTDSLGRSETYRFEGDEGLKRVVEHTRADGSALRFEYDAAGRRVATIDALGRATRYALDPEGRLLGVQAPDGQSSRLDYDANGRLVSRQGRAGSDNEADIVARYVHDALGRITEVWLDDKRVELRGYDDEDRSPSEQPTEVIDAKGSVKYLEWDLAGQLLAYTDCSNRTTRYRYSGYGETVRVVTANDQAMDYRFDQRGRLEHTRYPDGTSEAFQYDAANRLIAVVPHDSSGERAAQSVASVNRDALGRITARAHGSTTLSYAYDTASRLITLTNENASHTSFTYDVMDRLIEEVGFDGRTQSYAYNEAGELIEATDSLATTDDVASQIQQRFAYDRAGRLIERIVSSPTTDDAYGSESAKQAGKPDGQPLDTFIHRYTHNAAGLVTSVEARLAHHSALAQPADKNLELSTFMDSKIAFERDRFGRLVAETQTLYELGADSKSPQIEFEHAIAHRYDELGNRIESELPQNLGTLTYQHYGSGHLHGIVLNGQSIIDFERDNLHREIERTLHTQTGQAPVQLKRQFDRLGRLTEQAAPQVPELTRSYQYNALGQLIEVHHASMNTPGAERANTLAQERTQYTYDPLGRLIAAQREAMGTVVSVGMGIDASNRKAGELLARFDYRFDAAGNRLSASSKGALLDQIASNSLHGLGDAALDAQKASWHDQVQKNLQNKDFNFLQKAAASQNARQGGAAESFKDNRITYHVNNNQLSTYRYDAFGNRIEVANHHGNITRYRYDCLHRLIEVHGGMHHARYRYDALGRRLCKIIHSDNAGATYYGWDGDRLIHTETNQTIEHTLYEPETFIPLLKLSKRKGEPTAAEYFFGVAGESTESANEAASSPLTAMTHEQQRMMDDMFKDIAKNPSIARDALARMHATSEAQKQQIAALTKDAANSSTGAKSEDETSDANSPLAHLENLLAQHEKAKKDFPIAIHHIHCDHLGTPVAMVAANGEHAGKRVWSATYDPWGNLLEEKHIDSKKPIVQLIRFQGQHFDEESGLHYNRYRYYDATIGSYISQDPIRLLGGISFYAYPLNPLTAIDPLGLVDLNLFNSSESIKGYADKVPKSSSVFKVGGHGNADIVVDASGNPLTPSQLAAKIKADPKYKEGMPVELLSCNTGKKHDGYASKLAKELGAEVRAPDQYLWYDSTGKTTPMGLKTVSGAQVMDTTAPGTIKTFSPPKKP